MATLRLELLGGLQAFAAGDPARPLALPSRKVQALLVYLALQPGRPQPRAKLAALLWSESNEAQARASLRQALLVLRRTPGLEADALHAGPGETLSLDPACIEVDALAFERLLDDGSAQALEQAALLYRGELCEALDTREAAFDDWLAARRQQLRERALALWSCLLAQHEGSGRGELAVDAALRLLALDPLQEPVHRSLMQLYARQGRRGAALRQFRLCRDLLARELGTRPQNETLALREAIERQSETPPAPGAEPPPGAAQEAELRPVAVLVVESAQLADEVDPERAQEQAERFVAAVSEQVKHFGGAPERRLGSGLTALFGVPRAHGDDLLRAARCALALREAMPGLQLGLATGTVLLMRQAGAPGPAVSLGGEIAAFAARLSGAAAVGDLLLAPAAWRTLAPRAEGQRCPPQALPPALRAAGAWRLASLRPAAPRASLVGRRAELAQFGACLQACRESGAGQVLHVRGDAGIGKTRLVEEFRAAAGAQGFACHEAAVLDFGLGAGRDAIRTLVYSLLELDGDEGDNGNGDPHAATMATALHRGGLDAGDEIALRELLQLPMPPALRPTFDAIDLGTRERRQGELLARLLRHCSRAAPSLVVLEDLHWAPARTLRLAAALAGAAGHCQALLVTTARAEADPLDAPWRAAAGAGALVTFDLGPLRWAEASALAAQFGDVADGFTLRCLERSGGNPLFLEQLMLGVRGAGGGDALPDSVRSVVIARLDRLSPRERQLVRVASVLGQRFTLAALAHLLEVDPGRLQPPAHGLLRFEGAEGMFAHALVHEGAYASLPGSVRRTLHARAAAWFAGRDIILRAEHLERAADPAAAQAFLAAAQTQAAVHDPERALQLAARGLSLAHASALRFALACCRADALQDLGRMTEAQAGYEAALAAAGDDAERCRAWLGLAAVLRVRDDLDGAAALLAQVDRAATARGLLEARARAHYLRGNLLFPRGELDGCRREHQASLALAREAGAIEVETAALGGLGDAEFLRGRMLSARGHFADCVLLARRHGLRRVEAANQPMAAFTRWYGGDARGAVDEAQAAIEVATTIGHRRAEAIAHHGAYQFRHGLMEFELALAHAERALTLAREIGAPRFEAEGLAFRGELLRSTGRRAQAVDALQQALSIARATGMAYMGPTFLGMLALAASDAALRAQALAEGEALLTDNALAHNHLLFRRDAIDACLEAGDRAGALRHAAAIEALTRSEALPWSDFLVARARALAAAAGGPSDAAAARAQCERARHWGRELGLLVALPALDAALQRIGASDAR